MIGEGHKLFIKGINRRELHLLLINQKVCGILKAHFSL